MEKVLIQNKSYDEIFSENQKIGKEFSYFLKNSIHIELEN